MRQNWDFLPLCTICTKMGSQSTITAVSKSWSSISRANRRRYGQIGPFRTIGTIAIKTQ